ncbi:MAG: bifunctional 2-C-methyl-D-erythritol 4-phosphate cytidylyltransferase/2-C-methyl-D-erythritol 2,4-cyclodiphosphate synthase, partial [Sphingomonadales bacterium]
MSTAAIIVAAGKGIRAGGTVPKQFALLCGKPILTHSVTALSSHPMITQTIIVVGEGQQDHARAV